MRFGSLGKTSGIFCKWERENVVWGQNDNTVSKMITTRCPNPHVLPTVWLSHSSHWEVRSTSPLPDSGQACGCGRINSETSEARVEKSVQLPLGPLGTGPPAVGKFQPQGKAACLCPGNSLRWGPKWRRQPPDTGEEAEALKMPSVPATSCGSHTGTPVPGHPAESWWPSEPGEAITRWWWCCCQLHFGVPAYTVMDSGPLHRWKAGNCRNGGSVPQTWAMGQVIGDTWTPVHTWPVPLEDA